PRKSKGPFAGLRLAISTQQNRVRALVLEVPALRRAWHALRLIGHGFRGEAITLRASALTYLTLVSLVPLLAVIYAVLDVFTGQDALRVTLSNWVNGQLGVGAGAAITTRLDEFIAHANVRALGAIGFSALLVSVILLLWSIESAFNHIYDVKRPRTVIDRLLKYWSFLTLGPAFLALSISLTFRISSQQSGHGHEGHSEILHVLTAVSAVAITYVSLGFLYKVLPNARVSFSAAAFAAFVAGTLWELAKFGFAVASTRMVQLNKIYGSLAVLPIVLMWVYISWMITLIGCRLCFAMDESAKGEPHPLLKGAAARELLTARVMVELCRQHRLLGKPVSLVHLARELSVRQSLVKECLTGLHQGGGIAVETKDGTWLPGRDTKTIQLSQVRTAARRTLKHPGVEGDLVTAELLKLWQRADDIAGNALDESLFSLLERLDHKTEPPVLSAQTPGVARA
ncbi:MAG: YihY family inner membrane protein, partial [Deltaproteobacteria bacterium]|nr:YihY family inner membrane protein [Deltaproteobacteria bacterium]